MSVRHAVGFSLVVALLAVGAPGLAAAGEGDACDAVLTNRTGDGEPGEALAGAIGEQESEIAAELAGRRFDARLRNATTPAERARVVAAELERLREHVDAIAACAASLRNRSEAGALSEDAFHERMAALAADANATAIRVNETAAEARRLPAAVRREYDVTAAAIEELRARVLALRESLRAVTTGNETDTGGVVSPTRW